VLAVSFILELDVTSCYFGDVYTPAGNEDFGDNHHKILRDAM
jgi:hypothetical protein